MLLFFSGRIDCTGSMPLFWSRCENVRTYQATNAGSVTFITWHVIRLCHTLNDYACMVLALGIVEM